jgi:hypothetical protein
MGKPLGGNEDADWSFGTIDDEECCRERTPRQQAEKGQTNYRAAFQGTAVWVHSVRLTTAAQPRPKMLTERIPPKPPAAAAG